MQQNRTAGTAIRQIENDRVIVTKWDFQPGQETGFHTHKYDYIVVPLETGTLKIIDKNGAESTSDLSSGLPYYRPRGISHNVINANAHPFTFIEIELV